MARACLRLGQVRQTEGRYADADALLQRALLHADAAGAELERATVLGALAASYWLGPLPTDVAISRCRELLQEHGSRRAVRVALHFPLAALHASRRDLDTARSLLDEAQAIVDELGHAYAAAPLPLFRARVELLAGEWDLAESLLRSAADACEGLGDGTAAAAAGRDLARVLLRQGRHEEALQRVTAETRARTATSVAEELGIRARVLALHGRETEARQLAESAVTQARYTDSLLCRATAEYDRAGTLLVLGDRDGGRAAALSARGLYAEKRHLVGIDWAAALLEEQGAP